ncbi:MAG: hypothetical protein QNJ72_30260 [Pleurocapsa sp. MO_226.B13]|nr:hypothetical protein [Pleurocapsa sp. MO_226.B13]
MQLSTPTETYQQSLTQNKFPQAEIIDINKKRQLVARWKKVDGKLVCQWTTV